MFFDTEFFKCTLKNIKLFLCLQSRHSVDIVWMSFAAALSDRLILLSFLEQSQVAAVYLHRKNQDSPETGRRTDKLSPSEIKVQWNTLMWCS